jgi:ABC-2 type transport system ATP-binding protein
MGRVNNDADDPAVRTRGLGKRYGSTWALQGCTLEVPRGRVTALVGANGAGKTTLLRTLVGLSAPSAGEAWVLGRRVGQATEFLSGIGFLAQEAPLYRRLSVTDHLDMCAAMNTRWDDSATRTRLSSLRIPFDRPVATLSGGQRSQVALSLALSKQPDILFLDEPVAALDPLARREFLASLVEAVADRGLSVMLSSHLITDLERVCDHLVLLAASRVQLSGDIEEVLSTHRMLVGPRGGAPMPDVTIVHVTHTERQSRLIARTSEPILDPSWEVSEVGLEEIVLAYMGADAESDTGGLSVVGRTA